jgi:hypothetical protein
MMLMQFHANANQVPVPQMILEIFVRIVTKNPSETIFRVGEADKLMGALDGFRPHDDLNAEMFTAMQASIWSQPAPDSSADWQEFFEAQGKAVASLYTWLDGAYSYMYTHYGGEGQVGGTEHAAAASGGGGSA